jgi:hypothetical protein
MDAPSITYPPALLKILSSRHRLALLAGAGALLLLLLAPALAEAQQTLCLRMGAMIQCDTPAPPPVQRGRDWGDGIGDFSDTILRNRELDIRQQESAARAELLRQQAELLRRQNEQLRRQQEQPPAPPQPTERVAAPAGAESKWFLLVPPLLDTSKPLSTWTPLHNGPNVIHTWDTERRCQITRSWMIEGWTRGKLAEEPNARGAAEAWSAAQCISAADPRLARP